MAKRVSAFEARTHFGEVLDGVRYTREPYVVERNGKPVAAIITYEAFQSVAAQLARSSLIEDYSPKRVRAFLKADRTDPRFLAKARRLARRAR